MSATHRGSMEIFRARGLSLRLDWTILLATSVLSLLEQGIGRWIAFGLIVLIHELGHAFWVRRYGGHVHAITIHGFGGECSYSGDIGEREHVVIAWGGVMGQALLFVAARLPISLGLSPQSPLVLDLLRGATTTNLLILALNLLPLKPLDGHLAWRIFAFWWRDAKEAIARRRRRSTEVVVDIRDYRKRRERRR